MHHAAEARANEVLRFVIERLECGDDIQVASEISSTNTQEELGYVVTREDLVAIYSQARPALDVAAAGLPGAIDYLVSGGLSPASIVRWLDSVEGIDVIGHRTTSAELIGLLRHGRLAS